MKACSRRSEETLKAFESLKPKLQSLLVMWTEWETELLRLEDIAKDGIASRTNTLRGGRTLLPRNAAAQRVPFADEMEAIRTVESKYDELVPLLSASARLASNQRLELLRMKVRHLSRVSHGVGPRRRAVPRFALRGPPFSLTKRSHYQNCRSSYPLKCSFSGRVGGRSLQ